MNKSFFDLTPRETDVFVMVYDAGLSHEEVAKHFSVKGETVCDYLTTIRHKVCEGIGNRPCDLDQNDLRSMAHMVRHENASKAV